MANLRISWPAAPAEELVSQYAVHRGVNGGALTLIGYVNEPVYNEVGLSPGVYRWAYTKINFVGTSGLSPETSGPDVPSTPTEGPTVTVLP